MKLFISLLLIHSIIFIYFGFTFNSIMSVLILAYGSFKLIMYFLKDWKKDTTEDGDDRPWFIRWGDTFNMVVGYFIALLIVHGLLF